jgi:AbrB family looped-hinge helix DNA binding protein
MEFKTQINKSGRLILPAKMRKALEIQPGDELVIRIEGGSIRIIPLQQAIKMAQKSVRKYVPEGVSLVGELLTERRDEVNRE